MANPNFELTEEERLEEEARIRAAAGPALPRVATPIEIPGPPNEAAAQRGRDIRESVARDILQNLDGTETPEFLEKLRLNANLGSDNAGAPANNVAGFTPVQDPGIARTVNQSIDVPPTEDTFLDDLGRSVVDLPGRLGRFAQDIPRQFSEDFIDPAMRLPGQIERGIASGFPNLAAESDVLIPPITEAFEGFTDADAGGRGEMIGQGLVETASSGIRGLNELGRDILSPLADLGVGALGVARGIGQGVHLLDGPAPAAAENLEDNPPPTEVTEPDPTGSKDVDTQGDLGDDGTRAEQDRKLGGGGGEPAATSSFVSDQSGVESGIPTLTPNLEEAQFNVDMGDRAVAANIDAPPLAGTEIIRGTNRTFQPFDQEGRGFPALGEQPIGDDPIERLQNLGFERDQIAPVLQAQAQQQIAQTNALTPTTITDPQSGEQFQGWIGVDENGQSITIRSDQSVPVGANLIQSITEVPFTDELGETTKLKVPIFYEAVEEAGQTILTPVRISQAAVNPDALIAANPEAWQAVQQEVQRQGLTGEAAENGARQLLIQFLEQQAQQQ